MGKIIFEGLLIIGSVSSFIRPWVGVVLAYLIIILTPQNIWWWNFSGTRPVLWILLPTIVGLGYQLISGSLKLSIMKNRQSLYLLGLWIFFALSYAVGPYVNAVSPYKFHQPSIIFGLVNKIFVLYFIGCVLINDQNRLRWLSVAMIISVIYLIFWTNNQYLSHLQIGRIGGPSGGTGGQIYSDENTFAMLFVSGIPFLFYMGLYLKKKWLRWMLWLIIPFGWHAIFLTGSRGGLVGLSATLMLLAFRSPKKMIGILMIPAFIAAFAWQAGDLMKSRAETISEFETETSAATRIQAWKAALSMISDYPFSGVGLASFGPAFPDHSHDKPREAHNTFLQITAESGIFAGIMYLLISLSLIIGLWKNGIRYRNNWETDQNFQFMYYLNESVLVGFTGMFICALFLSLQVYELFYYLCLLSNSILFVSNRQFENLNENFNQTSNVV